MFNSEKFMMQKYKPREKAIKVAALSDLFEGEPEWVVRGLTANEVAEANEAQERARNLSGLIENLIGGTSKDKIDAAKEALGLSGDKVPLDIVKRLAILRLGSVSPKCDQPMAVKLATTHSAIFYDLTNNILVLTGMGQEPGE